MKRTRASQEMTRLNGAAFRIGADAVRSGRLDVLMEEMLSQVLGGLDTTDSSTCTEFTCNVYAPPPPPTQG